MREGIGRKDERLLWWHVGNIRKNRTFSCISNRDTQIDNVYHTILRIIFKNIYTVLADIALTAEI